MTYLRDMKTSTKASGKRVTKADLIAVAQHAANHPVFAERHKLAAEQVASIKELPPRETKSNK